MATYLEQWISVGQKLGYAGVELREFVASQQNKEREERALERESKRVLAEITKQQEIDKETLQMEWERQREEREDRERREKEEREDRLREQERKFELEKLALLKDSNQSLLDQSSNKNDHVKLKGPKLHEFKENVDSMDAYIERFERFATIHKWPRDSWAINLSTLLTGKAIEVYSRLGVAEAFDYDCLKEAILKRYQLTEEGFKHKFQSSKPEIGETPSQFISRLSSYLNRWLELSKVEKSYKGIFDHVIKEQFLFQCEKDLAAYLREQTVDSLQQLAISAERYNTAHNKSFGKSDKPHNKNPGKIQRCQKCHRRGHDQNECWSADKSSHELKCHNCGELGHIAPKCPKIKCHKCGEPGHVAPDCQKQITRGSKTCFLCGAHGHVARDCVKKQTASALAESSTVESSSPVKCINNCNCVNCNSLQVSHTGSACVQDISPVATKDSCECVTNESITLACGRSLPIIVGSCHKVLARSKLPVTKGVVNGSTVEVLRDTGCTGIVIKKSLINPNQFIEQVQSCMLIDGSILKVPMAHVFIDSPYFTGYADVMCMKEPVYDLIIGNVPGAKPVDKPDELWKPQDQMIAVMTRSAAQKLDKALKPLNVVNVSDDIQPINVDKMISLQQEDEMVQKSKLKTKKRKTGSKVCWFQEQNNLVYRFLSDSNGKVIKQIVVPKCLQNAVLTVAHASILAGHLGVQKTLNRILSNFFWSGIEGDVKRFCRSCDICQRTVAKGAVTKVPLGNTPVIDIPFKRVAVDLVGPIFPISENGYRYILTLVDVATRYPEAVPLKQITTEAVAEALLNIFSRVGVPEEMLSDLGSQFISGMMKELSRLLSIQRLTTTPYHPMANGLVEKMNCTIKSMLKKLTAERPKDWDRYLAPLLFAYREVPQSSTGFSPFELLYGRSVRGPMQILKEYWTNDKVDDDVKNTYLYVLDLQNRLEETCEMAREELQKSQTKYASYYNRKARDRSLQPGDNVLIMLPTDSNKLLLRWKGPFKVVQKVSPYDYKIDMNGKSKMFHINMLKKYLSPNNVASTTLVLDTESSSNNIFQVAASADIGEDEESIDDNCFDFRESQAGVESVILNDELTAEQRQEVSNLLHDHSNVFSDLPGCTNLIEHRILVTSVDPVRVKPYPVPFAVRTTINGEIDKMLKLNVIEPSTSPYAAPVVLVKKKDGSIRFCIDFRQLNRITVFDPEPMTNQQDIFTKLKGDKYFTKIDLCKGYWQIPMHVNDKEKTAFLVSDRGCFHFSKMAFGLVNSGATFTRMMRKLLSGVEYADSYIDDVLIHTSSWSSHLKVLGEVLGRLSDSGLTAKPSKCMVGFHTIDFVGHKIGSDLISPEDQNVDKVRNAPRPTTKKEVRSFVGLVTYYSNHIKNFAELTTPFTDLTKKSKPNKVVWNENLEQNFHKLKQLITSEPCLKLPDFGKMFVLQVDASDIGVGCSLLQEEDGKLMPISFASRKLLPREKSYSIIEKECLAVVFGVRKFHQYLYGRQFILQTDHLPLVCFNKSRIANDRIMRWAMLLQPYCMKIQYIRGSDNVIADFLSRSPTE